MSLMDLNQLSLQSLVAEFVLNKRGQGVCLSRDDHRVIESWLKAGDDPDYLLFVLDEVLPSERSGGRPLPLKLFDKKVLGRIMRRRS